jgi:nucleoid-associated protein YgaU
MVFRALNEGQAFRVEPLSWMWYESAEEARFSYDWELTLEGYAAAPQSPLTSIFSPVTESLQKIQEYLNAAAGGVALASVALDNVGTELGEVKNTLRAVGHIATALESVVDSADGLKTLITEEIPAAFAAMCEKYTSAWDTAVEAGAEVGGDEYTPTRDAQTSILRITAENLRYQALVIAGLAGVEEKTLVEARGDTTPAHLELRATSNPNAQKLGIPYTWRAADTMQSLALRTYGDAARWGEIVVFNGLRDAYTLGNGRPLRAGDLLYIPVARTEADRGQAQQKAEPYGVDLAIENGDIPLQGNDLRLSRGVSNLEQAIRHRLITEQGEAWILPRYGLPVRVGSGMNSRAVAYAAAHTREQLLADPRIRAITGLEVREEGGALFVSVSVQPLAGGVFDLITPFPLES